MPEKDSDPRATSDGDQSIGPTDEKEKKQDDPPQQEWKWLYSSNLVQYRYRSREQTLTIVFHGNRRYTFRGVDKDTADGLGTAGSAGHYFHTKIKGKFPFSRGEGGGGEPAPKGGFRGGGATGSWNEGSSGATGSW